MVSLVDCFGMKLANMPRTDEKLTRFWLWVLKIPMIIIVGVAAFFSKRDFEFITAKGNERLLMSPPYNSHIELAHHLTYAGLMALFGWLFISAVLIFYARGVWLFWIGLVDLALAITIAIGVGYQADYLPTSKNGCSSFKHNTSDSFFYVAYDLGKGYDASDSCNRFVRVWQIVVGALFFQMLITYIEIFFDTRPRSVLHPCRPLYVFVTVLMLPALFLQRHLLPKIQFAWRYAVSVTRRMRGLKELELPPKVTYIPRSGYIVGNPKLQEVLNIEHVLLEVVKNLHYVDIINFSLTSRAVREAVYPARDLEFRVPKLKQYCCDKASKCSCLYCNMKICLKCKSIHHWPGLPGRRHIKCKPVCVKCYYRKYHRHSRNKAVCACHFKDTVKEWQDMCRTCGLREQEEAQQVRHKRYQQEARDIAFNVHSKGGKKPVCCSCKTDMKRGICFWLCGTCNSPCKASIHPAFVETGKLDVEKVQEGEHEVETRGWIHSVLDKFRVSPKQAG